LEDVKENVVKIESLCNEVIVNTGNKLRSYHYTGDRSRFTALLESEFLQHPDFEPDEVFAHESCRANRSCSLPTLECYFGLPKHMPDMPQYGPEFMAALTEKQNTPEREYQTFLLRVDEALENLIDVVGEKASKGTYSQIFCNIVSRFAEKHPVSFLDLPCEMIDDAVEDAKRRQEIQLEAVKCCQDA
jgi:hypothetical protein